MNRKEKQHDLFRRIHRARPRGRQETAIASTQPRPRPSSRTSRVARHFEAWDDVPEGKVTDFRMAVDAKPDEKIVFSWFEYPDKASNT